MSHIAPELLPEPEESNRLHTLLHHGARPPGAAPAPLTLAARFGVAPGDGGRTCPSGGFPGGSDPDPRAETLAMGSCGRT